MRGTPLMLQLIVVYFGPYYLFRMKVGADYRFIAVIIAFSINYAAYFAEIYRSGLAGPSQRPGRSRESPWLFENPDRSFISCCRS